MLINNNDRNEDNWGVIKNKIDNTYKLAPIYDCGNCFYGKASDEKIANILADNEKLKSSATNGITAYEDDLEKRIPINKILELKNDDLKKAIVKVSQLIDNHLDEIINFIQEIPTTYSGITIMSKIRKTYYIETFKIRFETLLKKQLNK